MAKLKPTKIETGAMYRALNLIVKTNYHLMGFDIAIARRTKDILTQLKTNGYMLPGFIPIYIRKNTKQVIVIEGKLGDLYKEIHVINKNDYF